MYILICIKVLFCYIHQQWQLFKVIPRWLHNHNNNNSDATGDSDKYIIIAPLHSTAYTSLIGNNPLFIFCKFIYKGSYIHKPHF
ncbi:hypothetical protein BDF14DRAFT_1775422 [Spinellus fusiger]|nr:hypothetical protein BDF14DRAFT_1775422 [Spinellus fusiger]